MQFNRANGLTCGLALVVFITSHASASLTLLSGPSAATHAGNLVGNGSFETGSLGAGPGNTRFWAAGTSLTPFAIPPNWNSYGDIGAYAFWGADTPPNRLRFSDNVPDGQVGLYFGNGLTTFDQVPTFHSDGRVTFPATPNSSKGNPVGLWQTVPTQLTPSPSYLLSFWASGENAGDPNSTYVDGIFGLRVTNVLPGDPIQYFAVPAGPTSAFGASRRYDFNFVPLNSSLPVTIEFLNWGHVDLNMYGMGFCTELVLDDVIINPVPEPAGLLLMLGGLPLTRRRFRSRRAV